MRNLSILCALLALAACQKPRQQSANELTAGAEAGPVKGVDRSEKGKPAPDVSFKDPDGGETSLAEFSGKPLLVNLWATWCAPCVRELPALDKLSRSPNGLQILAISQDTAPHASVVAFLESHKIANLSAYQDPEMGLSGGLNAQVLPTSILYDANGREQWRYVGDLDWGGAEAAKLLSEAGATRSR